MMRGCKARIKTVIVIIYLAPPSHLRKRLRETEMLRCVCGETDTQVDEVILLVYRLKNVSGLKQDKMLFSHKTKNSFIFE